MKVVDFFTKLEIDDHDCFVFYSEVHPENGLVIAYTKSGSDLVSHLKMQVYCTDGVFLLLLPTLIDTLVKTGKYKYGKYNTSKLYHVDVLGEMDKPVTYRKFDNVYRFDSYVDPENKVNTKIVHSRNMEFGTISPTNTILEGNDYTYGVEIETSHGRVDRYKDLNLNCVYDGSLKDEHGNCYGGEYVTGVLRGDTGLFHLKKISNRLVESNCGVNHRCSIHVHVGNINWSQEQTIMAWALGCMLENEIFSMMPHSRRNNEFCQNLKDKYPLEIDFKALSKLSLLDGKINTSETYNAIHKVVVSGISKMPDKTCNKMSNHPEGAKQRYNHNAQRYCWLNFVPLMFNIRGNTNARTIEFRCHSSTLNYKKIENWLKICVGFVNVIDTNLSTFKQGKITTLTDVVTVAYPKTHSGLVDYIALRKAKFKNSNQKAIAEADEYQEVINVNNGSIKELVCA